MPLGLDPRRARIEQDEVMLPRERRDRLEERIGRVLAEVQDDQPVGSA